MHKVAPVLKGRRFHQVGPGVGPKGSSTPFRVILALIVMVSLGSPSLAQQRVDVAKLSPSALAKFLTAMPKGGELHVHVGGIAPPELKLKWAEEDDECINVSAMTVEDRSCPEYRLSRLEQLLPIQLVQTTAWQTIRSWAAGVLGEPRAVMIPARKALSNFSFREMMIRQLAVHGPSASARVGHDKFFKAFVRYDMPTSRMGQELALLMSERAEENAFYEEVSITPEVMEDETVRLANSITWDSAHFDTMRQHLLDAGVGRLVQKAMMQIDKMWADAQNVLKCGTSGAQAGCKVNVRFLPEVDRHLSPAAVFAQAQLAVALVKKDPLCVGVQMAGIEDSSGALRNYELQMQELAFLTNRGAIKETLHAGELTPGLVSYPNLQFHVRDAVEVAGATRIGHAADIMHEQDSNELALTMAKKLVLVEVNLSSNKAILALMGKEHPFRWLEARGVPISLSTDDPGILNSSLSKEFELAVLEQKATYSELKTIARNSLSFSFLPGSSLWEDNGKYEQAARPCADRGGLLSKINPRCQQFLAKNEKAREQWRLEQLLIRFELQNRPNASP